MKSFRETVYEHFIHPAVIIFGAYALAHLATVTVLSAAIIGVTSDPTKSASLIFLPHGIRIIAAWLYGWRAVLYIVPPAYFIHILQFPDKHSLTVGDLLGPVFGVLCASLCFFALARIGYVFRYGRNSQTNWKDLVLVGALASMINSAGTNLAYGNSLDISAAYFIGDIFGMITVMFITMMCFRVHRKYVP